MASRREQFVKPCRKPADMEPPTKPDPLHLATIFLLVALEYLQSGMVSFSSSFISGGIGAAPEEFSLAAAGYAAVAVVMLFQHRLLARTLGYRRFLLLSLLAFAVGAGVCATASAVPAFVAGRMLQAAGGAAFFTAARVQVLHYRAPVRMTALVCFGYGIFAGSGGSASLAATLIEQWGWRAIFVAMLAATALVAVLVEFTVPAHEPFETETGHHAHPLGVAALALGSFALQFGIMRSRYEFFSRPLFVAAIIAAALVAIAFFVIHELRRSTPLVPFRAFVDGRYLAGMAVYAFCYVVSASSAFVTPVFLVQGLGFAVQSTGWLLSLSSALSLLLMPLVLRAMARSPGLKKYLLLGFAALLVYGLWMSRMSEEVTQTQVLLPLLLANSVFLMLVLSATASAAFQRVADSHFVHAYMVKNVIREISTATGISLATVLLQERSTLHYQRLVEVADPMRQYVGAAQDTLARLAGLVARQATLMACQDYFLALAALATAAAALIAWQRKPA
jgi:MFS family permease